MDSIFQELKFLDLENAGPDERCLLLELIQPGTVIPGVELPWKITTCENLANVQQLPSSSDLKSVSKHANELNKKPNVPVSEAVARPIINESNQISVNAPIFVPAAASHQTVAKVPFSTIPSNVHHPYPQYYSRPPFPPVPTGFSMPSAALPVATYEEPACLSPNIYPVETGYRELKNDEIVDIRHKPKSYTHERINGRRRMSEKKPHVDSTVIDMANMLPGLEGYMSPVEDASHLLAVQTQAITDSDKLSHGIPQPTMLSMQHPPPPYHLTQQNLHVPPGTSGYSSSMHFPPQAQHQPVFYFVQHYPPGFVPPGASVSPSLNGEDIVINHGRSSHGLTTRYEGQPLTMGQSYPSHQNDTYIANSIEEHYMPPETVAYTSHMYSPQLTTIAQLPVKSEPVLNEMKFDTNYQPCVLSGSVISEDFEGPTVPETESFEESAVVVEEFQHVVEVDPIRAKSPEEASVCFEDSGVDLGSETPPPSQTVMLNVNLNEDKLASPQPNSWGGSKSWADLFKGSKTANASSVLRSGENITNCIENGHNGTSDDSNLSDSDYVLEKVGRFLRSYQLNFNPESVQPRGLINRSNWCYINATLQAILACPQFYNLLRDLPVTAVIRGKSNTPVMNSLVHLIHEFVPHNPKTNKKEDLNIGSPFEPLCIHQMLAIIKSECVKGRQEDAEEFLSCILNGLHEEMMSMIKSVSVKENGTCNGVEAVNGHLESNEDENGGPDWHLMGPKGKGVVTRCSAQHSQSPITSIFGGQIRSLLIAETETSATLQPFFTLPLDIQGDGVDSVIDALTHFTAKETIQGYICPKTKKEVEATRRLTLEELPVVLILHFKRFIYEYQDGGSKKVLKKTEYPLDLEIRKELLSAEVRSKYGAKHLRTYRLFAVVYHDGKEAVKGHYIADIYHAGTGSWLRCDDRKIHPTSEQQVLAYNSPCVPYLLFYGRSDVEAQ